MRDFLRSPLFTIFLVIFVDVLGVGITVPVLPLFAKNQLGASAFEVGLISTVYFFVQTLAAPQLGRLSDRVGRRPVLILSQVGTLIALLLSAWAPSYAWLLLARALDGLTGGNISVAFAYVGDASRPEQRARAMGVINAGFGAGFMFGPALGGYLGGLYGPRVPFLAAASVCLVTIALSVFRLKEAKRADQATADGKSSGAGAVAPRMALGEIVRLPGVPRILMIGFFAQLAMLCFTSMWVLWAEQTFLSAFAEGERTRRVGQVFTVLGVFQLITQAFVVGRLVSGIGEKRMVVLGLATRALAWAMMALTPGLWVVFGCLPFASVGSGIAQPALMALLTFAIPAEARGQAIGVAAAAESTGRVLGPLLAGVLFISIAPGAPIAVAAAVSLLAAAIALGIAARQTQNPLVRGAQPA